MHTKRCSPALAGMLLAASASFLSAQNTPVSWEEMMLDPNYSFFQIQQAFNQEWADKPYQSGNGYKQFKRWEYLRETTVDSSGIYPNLLYQQEFQNFLDSQNVAGAAGENKSSLVDCSTPNSGGNWSALGPFDEPVGNNGIGRVNVVGFHPTNASILWAGSPAGGLWKSTNGGTSWTTTTDNFTNLGVSDIATNPADPNIMYMGTGDRDHSDTYSFGLLKSTDAGATWTLTSMPVGGSFNLIHRVLLNPADPNILVVATSAGTYRSTNAGANWTQVNSLYFRHMEFKPGDPNTVYASSYPSAQFYRSTNGGASFSLVALPAPSSGSAVQRFAISVTAANPAAVFLLGSYNDPAGTNDFNGIYKSADSGATFAQTATTTPPAIGSQSWYDWTLAVSPANQDELYAGGVGFYKSTNGGVTWVSENSGGGVSVHVDHHFAGYQPGTSALFVGSDGGVFKTADGGANWVDLSDGLSITQYYRIGASSLNAGLTLAGSQDNGTHRLSAGTWQHVFGGDGMECLIDHANDNVMFASYQNGFVMKSTNGGNSFPITSITPNTTGETGAWVTPYVMDPSNSSVMYAGYKSIWKSVNAGVSWTNPFGPLTTNQIQHIAIAPSSTSVLYATDYSQVWKSVNAGVTWAAVTDPGSSIRSIAVHDTDPSTVWICRSNDVLKSTNGGTSWTDVSGNLPNIPMRTIVHQLNSNNAIYVGSEIGVWFKNDLLASWELFSDNLPNVIVDELQIFNLTGKIRAASFGRGVWESDLYCTEGYVCTDIVSNFPYEEGFETSLGYWQQDSGDNFDWTRQTGPTPTPNTGPDAAYEGTWYAYAEATGNTGGETRLLSPCLNLAGTTNPTFLFRYHMQGAAIGSLHLEASTNFGTSWTSIWSRTGNQGSSWLLGSASLTPYAGSVVLLRFRAVIAGDEGDIALDELYINDLLSNPSACLMGRSFPDNSCTAANQFSVNVASAPGTALGTNVFLTNAKIIIEHTWDADLDITLYSPSGAAVLLSSDNGGSGDNYGNPASATCTSVTNFTMSAATAITAGTAPFIGSYRPEGNFTSFNDGSSPLGVWVLEACDDEATDVGYLEFVELVFAAPPACTNLTSPANGATGVATTAALTWAASAGSPTGYRLDVGTTSGGTQILNNFDVGNVTTYNPPGDFPSGTVIYVKIKPYNAVGTNTGCPQESFTTASAALPSCTSLTSPANGAANAAVTAALTWAAASGSPTGYRLDVGTTSGGTDILNNFDAGNVTTYNPPGDFPFNTAIFVKIKPYNANGSASGCAEESFTTQVAPPNCTSLTSPANGAANVAVTAALTWTAATGAPTGYRLDVGTTSGGTDILNNADVGNVTTHNPPGDFPFNTTIFVKVKPYNGTGSASGCAETSFTTQIAPPNCTSLSSPANGAANVAVTAALTWAAATGAPTGYRLDVGTSSGGTDILNNFDAGNVTTYNPPGDFPFGTTIFVKVKPYNGTGSASGCAETSFTTQIAPPNCTVLSSPANGAANVAVTAALTWAAATGAPTGYRLDVGTSSGGTDILNNADVGNVTTHNPPGDFPFGTTIFVKVKPYNGTGSASGCTETSFTTQIAPPNCTSLSSPANGAANVAVTAALTWAAATGAPTGYRLDVGTSSGGTDILNNFDAGNVTTYNPPGDFPFNTTIFVKVKPYNGTGSASGCAETSFTTQAAPPDCTSLTSPANGAANVAVTAALTWAAATGAPTGYRLDIGTTPGGTDILNNFNVGSTTTYSLPGGFPFNTTIFVKIKPYNGAGSASGCAEESFTTQIPPPDCTSLTSPANGAAAVPANTSLTWAAATGAPDGYRLDIGTTPGGTDILNNFDVGNVTTYDPPGYFPYGATVYVKIKPYNATGSAVCGGQGFATATCIPNLVIVSVPVPAGSHKSLGDLVSNNSTVAVGTVVAFTSDTGVLLDQNFVVEAGGVFEVSIQACPTNLAPPEPPPGGAKSGENKQRRKE